MSVAGRTRRLVELSRDECLALLRPGGVGRIAVSGEDGPPEVAPVNFVLDGDAVVFRSGLGTKLTLLRHGPATFEADHVDLTRGEGWSVVVKGRAVEPSHWETRHLDVEPMTVPATKRQWVRLEPTTITGRRVTTADTP